jgi:hypothetical protein
MLIVVSGWYLDLVQEMEAKGTTQRGTKKSSLELNLEHGIAACQGLCLGRALGGGLACLGCLACLHSAPIEKRSRQSRVGEEAELKRLFCTAF